MFLCFFPFFQIVKTLKMEILTEAMAFVWYVNSCLAVLFFFPFFHLKRYTHILNYIYIQSQYIFISVCSFFFIFHLELEKMKKYKFYLIVCWTIWQRIGNVWQMLKRTLHIIKR